LSLIGGLFTSIGSIVATIVKKLTKSDFITAVSKSLFLVHKLSTIKPTKRSPPTRIRRSLTKKFYLVIKKFTRSSNWELRRTRSRKVTSTTSFTTSRKRGELYPSWAGRNSLDATPSSSHSSLFGLGSAAKLGVIVALKATRSKCDWGK